jgi:hypothetical protein
MRKNRAAEIGQADPYTSLDLAPPHGPRALRTLGLRQPFPPMANIDPLTPTEILAVDLALDAERAGVPIRAVAKPGCSAGLIAMAEQVRALVAEMRAELHADGAERGVSENEVDAAFSETLASMLERSGRVH